MKNSLFVIAIFFTGEVLAARVYCSTPVRGSTNVIDVRVPNMPTLPTGTTVSFEGKITIGSPINISTGFESVASQWLASMASSLNRSDITAGLIQYTYSNTPILNCTIISGGNSDCSKSYRWSSTAGTSKATATFNGVGGEATTSVTIKFGSPAVSRGGQYYDVGPAKDIYTGGVVAGSFAIPRTASITYAGPVIGTLTPGEYILDSVPVPVTCYLQPIQLEMNVTTPTVNFGKVIVGDVVQKELSINITSGTETPTGTLTFNSANIRESGRISLGGGEVSLKYKDTGQEILPGASFTIPSRNITFLVDLNAAGVVTLGDTTANLTVDMVVN